MARLRLPEDLADETINRVARRLAGGVELRSADPYGYFCGVAHLVYKEVLRRAAREHRALESSGRLAWPIAPGRRARPTARLDRLRRCLAGCPRPDQQRLVLRYHQGNEGEINIRNRQALSRELGLADERAPHPGPPDPPQMLEDMRRRSSLRADGRPPGHEMIPASPSPLMEAESGG